MSRTRDIRTLRIKFNPPTQPIQTRMTSNGSLKPIRVVIGCDNAGHSYKEALKQVIQKHNGVSEVIDVGVNDPKDGNAYPNIAVDAARKIKAGEVSALPLKSV